MITKAEIEEIIIANSKYLSQLGVKKIGLFGSYQRQEENESSDIDILVKFDPTMKNYDNYIALAEFLENKLGKKVDLITEESLSPHIGPRIKKEVRYFALSA
ncbi:MAG: nucleotidyltransferase family protein [Spirochaetia bacterium]